MKSLEILTLLTLLVADRPELLGQEDLTRAHCPDQITGPPCLPASTCFCSDDRLLLRFEETGTARIQAAKGQEIEVSVWLEAASPDIHALSLGLEHDASYLEFRGHSLEDSSLGPAECRFPPIVTEVPGGVIFRSVTGDFCSPSAIQPLEPGRVHRIVRLRYRLLAPPPAGGTFLEFRDTLSSGEAPPTPILARGRGKNLSPSRVVAAVIHDSGSLRRGDVDQDGNLTFLDLRIILQYLFQHREEPACLATLDLDASGTLDISDAVQALRKLFVGGPVQVPPCEPIDRFSLFCDIYKGCKPGNPRKPRLNHDP